MCIMEIRPGQHASTIAQAVAHNLSTIDRDCDMFVATLDAQGRPQDAQQVRELQAAIHGNYSAALSLFAHEVREDLEHWHTATDDHTHDHHGNERSLAAIVHADAVLARPFETR